MLDWNAAADLLASSPVDMKLALLDSFAARVSPMT